MNFKVRDHFNVVLLLGVLSIHSSFLFAAYPVLSFNNKAIYRISNMSGLALDNDSSG